MEPVQRILDKAVPKGSKGGRCGALVSILPGAILTAQNNASSLDGSRAGVGEVLPCHMRYLCGAGNGLSQASFMHKS